MSHRPRPHGEWIDEDHHLAQSQPGTAEYLSSLLTGPDHSCPHPDKTKRTEVPHRLGFFRKTDGTNTYLDTAKVCQKCYDQVTPQGFNVWSTAYKPSEKPMQPEDQRRYEQEGNWAALNVPSVSDYYPQMYQAGTEDGPNAMPITDRRLPSNAEARELWRWLEHSGQPFYVDQLHLTRPWDPNAPDQQAEDRRVAQENFLAYKNAARGFVGTGVGGAGVNSIVEQRILRDRAEEVPANFGRHPHMATHDEEINMTYESPAWVKAQGQRAFEVPTNFPEYWNMPDGGQINAEELQMRGYITRPTDNENDRRFNLEFNPRFNDDPSYAEGSRQLANNTQDSNDDGYEMRDIDSR